MIDDENVEWGNCGFKFHAELFLEGFQKGYALPNGRFDFTLEFTPERGSPMVLPGATTEADELFPRDFTEKALKGGSGSGDFHRVLAIRFLARLDPTQSAEGFST